MANRKKFRLWCRADRGGTYYYKFPGDSWVSTNSTDKAAAEAHVNDILSARRVAQLSGQKLPDEKAAPRAATLTLREYARDFFTWGKCPHCERIRADGGQVGPEYVERQRKLLETYVLKDVIADLPIGQIRRADCIDFRARMLAKMGANTADRENPTGKRTVNLILVILSTILGEAVEREDLGSNPAGRVGRRGLAVKYAAKKRGTFTLAEIKKMFPAAVDTLGPWRTLEAKTAFLLAGVVGMRRNEIRALTWEYVDLAAGRILIHRAFKGNDRPGLPKWDKRRECALPGIASRHLAALQEAHRAGGWPEGPETYIFAWIDGKPYGAQWWKLSFNRAVEKLEIDRKGRNLVPHSLRHSLATELRAAGVSDVLLKKSLGWSSDSMLENYSDHLAAEHFRGQAAAIDRLFG
jgi:integrase